MTLIAMAGLPGTGKSTIAAELAKRVDGIVLNKDEIRAQLFPKEKIDYSQEQDDFCMDVLYLIARHLHKNYPKRTVIIDGRTFLRSYQIDRLLSAAGAFGVKPAVIECICDDDTARKRLESDRIADAHPAKNRSYRLYRELKEKTEPIGIDHLTVDTGKEPLRKSIDRCVAYLNS